MGCGAGIAAGQNRNSVIGIAGRLRRPPRDFLRAKQSGQPTWGLQRQCSSALFVDAASQPLTLSKKQRTRLFLQSLAMRY
jgi:hypothetical protein